MAEQPWKNEGMTKADWVAREVGNAVHAGKKWKLDTVDFADAERPLTCLEVDFPIIPINQIAAIEGNAGKPIYQMSKWWARRRSSVFRSMLIAAATKAPDDPAEAAKMVWNAYYGNHQAKGAFKHLKVADIFMGGGTTVVEGSRLGMQMFGNDLNPVAWFIVKNEMAQVDHAEVEALLSDIERDVKPQIMPFYTCNCPRGHKGKWIRVNDGQVMGDDFDATALSPEVRKDYRYEGSEIIYVFWAKHGPCQVTGCGHRTPIMTSPVMAVKTLTVKRWARKCKACGQAYNLDDRDARMAPGVPLVVADTETPYAVATLDLVGKPASAVCPCCGEIDKFNVLPKGSNKKVELSLLVHPDWLRGEASKDKQGRPYGGSADDDVESTIRWNNARAATCRLIEVRGELPDEITCPETKITFHTGKEGGTVPGKSQFACQEPTCGRKQDIRESIAMTSKNGPVAMYAIQGYCPDCAEEGQAYSGRFFAPVSDARTFNASLHEWDVRKDKEFKNYWPTSEVPYGFMTAIANGDIRTAHGFTHWWKMFNSRQLIVHATFLKELVKISNNYQCFEFVTAGWLQYLRYQNMFVFFQGHRDCLAPHFSNPNYHPKANVVENSAYCTMGSGNLKSLARSITATIDWQKSPWEIVSRNILFSRIVYGGDSFFNESPDDLHGDEIMILRSEFPYVPCSNEKVICCDPVLNNALLSCCSSTELNHIQENSSYDMVVTDPPFGGLLHYSELSDFFYVWLRLVLKDKYPDYFAAEYTPKALEAVANRARQDNPDAFYQRLLTECWREVNRILKPGGLLAFTFHHSEDAPWVSVLESLFDAGFYLQATYPIRSDETKGEGEFGSKKIEYDIIHVCRKRTEEPKSTSWARLRRQILNDVRSLKELLEHHSQEGLPEADLQVIRRGKALEYFSRHYGQVFKEPGSPMDVKEALLGVNQLLEEETGISTELPPTNAEPYTRMLLRLFDKTNDLARDQLQKFLRGTGCGPSDFLDRGWVTEQNKIFTLVPALEIAQGWVGRKRKNMTSDYDQTMFFIGACHEGSGINANDTLTNPQFTPHPALAALLKWFRTHGGDSRIRDAATIASQLYNGWESRNAAKSAQLRLFDLGEEDK